MNRVAAILIALSIAAASLGGCTTAKPPVPTPAVAARVKFYEFYSPT